MKKVLFVAMVSSAILYAQVGISTPNPQGAFHVDAGKDNSFSGAPTAAQQQNDFVVTSAGNIGVGTIVPNAKVEINSGTANVSGLRFTNLTSATPVSTGQTIGVDASGRVVTLPNPTATNTTTAEVASVTGANFNVNDLAYTLIPGSSQIINIPTGGKAVFINFMLGIDYITFPAGSGAAYYQATLFIDGVASNVYLKTQERLAPSRQTQYTLSAVKFLTAGNHTLDVRMIRSNNIGTTSGANMSCLPISMSFNASYIN
ncbi:hypothetical protein [Chryseobacterium populi]|uniref:Uncharacterized protein n=1 Tax=Chryseobacterium populi TaxID=1144316 RepID=J3CGR2_9FLAO|nr:hypothetical protein [Chryseobacterium populi]EJL71026.1 hypothetical protein PMI13_02589 [Chryseobacterium populi]